MTGTKADPPPNEAEEGKKLSTTDNGNQYWKHGMFHHHVNRLWWIKFSCWLHALLILGGAYASFLLITNKNLSERIFPSFLISLVPLMLSFPYLFNWIATNFKCPVTGGTWDTVSLDMTPAIYGLVSAFLMLYVTNLSTLNDLAKVPNNDTRIIYSDRSSECLGILAFSTVTLITMLSLINMWGGLKRMGVTKNFLTGIGWNGKYLVPKYANLSCDEVWKKLRESEEEEWKSYLDDAYFHCSWLSSYSLFLCGLVFMKCREEACIDFVMGDFVITGLIFVFATYSKIRFILHEWKRLVGMRQLTLVMALCALTTIYSHAPDVKKLYQVFHMIRSDFGYGWEFPRFPLVALADDPLFTSKKMEAELNLTGEAARVSLNLLCFILKITGIIYCVRVFSTFTTLQKNRDLHTSSIVA